MVFVRVSLLYGSQRNVRNFYPNHLDFLGGLHTCFGLDSEDTSSFSGVSSFIIEYVYDLIVSS